MTDTNKTFINKVRKVFVENVSLDQTQVVKSEMIDIKSLHAFG